MDDIKLGALILVEQQSDDISSLPLEQTRVEGQVTGPVAVVTVEQRFSNPFQEVIELAYLFPLPEKAAVVDYIIHIGDRTIRAKIEERETARRTYQQAVEQGKRASLLEQRRPNLFSIQIGNVQPGEAIVTQLVYEDRLAYSDGAYEFVFPMGITPKYHDARVSRDEARSVDRPFVADNESVGPVEIQLSVDAGVKLQSPDCSTHDDAVLTTTGDNTFTANLKSIPNKDFRLTWQVSTDELRTASWGSRADDSETYLITLLPPRLSDDFEVAPREFIFVLDRSGSMAGRMGKGPIDQAVNALRACIRALDTSDTFTIQAFDNHIDWFADRPQAVTQANVDAADRWLNGINARGGTEIVGAIETALAIPDDQSRTRYVVFLTDGAVSAEDRALQQVTQKRRDARIFTFGIGPAVNRALLVKMAELGRGASEFLTIEEDIEGALIRFQDRVIYPVLFDLQLEWQDANGWDTYPATLPDLYVGQPLEITTKLARTGDTSLVVSGTLGDKPVSYTFELPSAESENPTIPRLWARARVESLMDSLHKRGDHEKVRQQVITLGLQHRIATAYTSFVAVDSEVTETDGDKRQVTVSGPLPEGLNPDSFGQQVYGAMPPMAAPRMSAGLFASASTNIQGILPSRNDLPAFLRKRAKGAGGSVDQESAKPEASDRLTDDLSAGAQAELNTKEELAQEYYEQWLSLKQSNGDQKTLDVLERKWREFGYQPDNVNTSISGTDRESKLKQFARTQNVNGSWDDSVDMTAAVLLTFIREGHTSRTGNYRRQVKKALDWLKAHASNVSGVLDYAVKRVIAEHDGTTLPSAPPKPNRIQTIDDLRLMAVLEGEASAPQSLMTNPVAQVWLAPGKPVQ